MRATQSGIRCAVSNTINSPSQSVVGTAACADPSEERLYRCSAGFSDFLISANVLAACKSRSAPRPTGLRPSVCAVAAVQHLSVQLRAAECLSPSAIRFVAVLKREYHNLHRWVTARAREWWSAPTDLGGAAISQGPSAVADGQHRIDVFHGGPVVTCGRAGGMVVSGGARRLT